MTEPTTLRAAGLRMRELQREYFRTRSREVLIASKAAEKEFDRMLAAPAVKTWQHDLNLKLHGGEHNAHRPAILCGAAALRWVAAHGVTEVSHD